MMTAQTCLLLFTISATAHIMLAAVLALYARYRVQYLALTWIMGIFGFCLVAITPFSDVVVNGHPGMLHPLMLLSLTATCFLQSIYPLSIPMPAYLQWGRMWRYACPAIILYTLYLAFTLVGMEPKTLHDASDMIAPPYSFDLLFRLAALCLGVYYIVNIFLLPQKLAQATDVPRYIKGYSVVLGLSVLFYMVVTIHYTPVLLLTYIAIFTLLNAYLAFRTLETMAISLPKPVIETVVEEPTEEVIEKAEKEDFNEANLQRFRRVEFWMQNHREEWKDNTFGRDKLCEATGINRHLTLQCLRSQGYNNVHDYINSYRIAELKRMIKYGEATNLTECMDAGFGTVKTVRTCFEKMEGEKLDAYLERVGKSQ